MTNKFVSFVFMILLFASVANGQFLGQMTSAKTLTTDVSLAGGYLSFAENSLSVVSYIRHGFTDDIEGRFRLGLLDPKHGQMGFVMGADVKYQMWEYRQNENPFDFSIGGTFEYARYSSDVDLFGGTASLIGSLPQVIDVEKIIEPYAALRLRLQSAMTPDNGTDTELKIGANIGAVFSVIKLADFTVEIQFDDDDIAFSLGADFIRF